VLRVPKVAEETSRPAIRRTQDHLPALVETLQRAAGNAAVTALLRARRGPHRAGPPLLASLQRSGCGPACGCGPCSGDQAEDGGESVQRAAAPASASGATGATGAGGPAGPLTSPRFAHHPELQACAADRARLAQGARGPAVAAVQQALLDRGHNLGASGADAKYGPITAGAVKDFKRKEALGFEQFGDVGPGTMRRLDALFPAEKPPGDFDVEVADEETDSCPIGPEIVLAAVNRGDNESPASRQAFAGPTGSGQAGSGQAVGAGNHLTIPAAVALFKQRVNQSDRQTVTDEGKTADAKVTDRGQFFWSLHMTVALLDELRAIGSDATDADGVEFNLVGRDAVFLKKAREPAAAQLGVLATIAARTKSPKKARMLALLGPARLGAAALEQLLWSQLNNRPDASLPTLDAHRTFATLGVLAKFDKTSCGTHALTMADRLKKRGGLVPRDPSFRGFSAVISAGTGVRDRRQRPPGSENHIGDVIKQTGVLGAIAQAQHALDAGMVVHARVLSGQGYGIQKGVKSEANARPFPIGPPPEEHSLLLIGFDASNFVFNDPDAGVSHEPENGFGMLHLDLANDRFGTARNEADLVVNPDGFHVDHNQKRYQVISLTAV
jgi:peptidoglycan hydrolase-like protein with peptidoglycan-binding domain